MHYLKDVHTCLCEAVGISTKECVRVQDPTKLDFKFVDEDKLYSVISHVAFMNGILTLYPKPLFDFSFYPKEFAESLNSIEETIDKLIESVPKYKGTFSYLFLWDILLVHACKCEILEGELFKCLKLQIGGMYENI